MHSESPKLVVVEHGKHCSGKLCAYLKIASVYAFFGFGQSLGTLDPKYLQCAICWLESLLLICGGESIALALEVVHPQLLTVMVRMHTYSQWQQPGIPSSRR